MATDRKHMSSTGIHTAGLWLSLRRNFGISWPLLLGVAGFAVPAITGYGLADGDTYLHIAAGRWMLAHGAALTHDPFSFTRLAAPSTAQEWGSDLMIATIFRVAGWSGLVLLAAACFGATLAYLMRFLLARMEPLHALVLTLFAAKMMVPSLLARPHVLVWPLTALWVGTLVRASERDRAPPWWLLGVLLLWVNMHGSFILGPFLAAALGLDAAVSADKERWSVAKRWAPFVIAAFACTFVNPQGWRLVLFPFQLVGQKAALAMIAEWLPPNFQHPEILGIWLVAIVTLAFLGRIRLSLVRAVLLVGLLYMALQHGRNVALLGLISPFLLAQPIAALWRRAPLAGPDASAVDRLFHALAAPARRLATCTLISLAALVAVIALNAREPMPPASARPDAAVDALLARVPHGRIFNDPGYGDYLMYRSIPDFMDDRVDVYGDAFLTRTVGALSLWPNSDLEGLLKEYRIDAILIGNGWAAVRLLDRLPDWQRVYSDKLTTVYVRRGNPRS